jgi:hypothetical protein
MHLRRPLLPPSTVRTAKFVPRKQWILVGADDMMVRVYNYNTMDKVRPARARTDGRTDGRAVWVDLMGAGAA